jgi:hypothetical protein
MENVFFIDKNNKIRAKPFLQTECKKCGSWILERPGDAGNPFYEEPDKYGNKKIISASSDGWHCKCGEIIREPKFFDAASEPDHGKT